jgi:hypothetical protein
MNVPMRRTLPAASLTPSADPSMNGTAGMVFAERCSPTTFALPFDEVSNFIIATEKWVSGGSPLVLCHRQHHLESRSPRIIRA